MKNKLNCFIWIILLDIQIILDTQNSVVVGEQLNLQMCSNNQTIGVQVFTKYDAQGPSCNCQISTLDDVVQAKSDYRHVPGIGSYKLYTEAKNWNDARKVCYEEGAHLAIINSRSEEEVLVEMLKNAANLIKGGLNTEEAFIGIHDMYKEGEWVTIFGEPLLATGYANWSPTYWGGQPDNYGNNQNCGAVLNMGGMDDCTCTDKFAYFCEKPLRCY